MKPIANYSLKNHNSFGFDEVCSYYCKVEKEDELLEAIRFADDLNLPIMPLGEGSNIVLTRKFEGVIIHLCNRGLEINAQQDSVQVQVAAGENWHDFVMRMIKKTAHGLENLSFIPGKVGAGPIQNIGAYGVEIKDRVRTVSTIELNSRKKVTFGIQECQFGYRDSVFKSKYKDQYIITALELFLDRDFTPILTYPGLQRLAAHKNPTAPQVSHWIGELRRAKLPDPKVLGNVGSFFKNPVVSEEKLRRLQKRHPDIVYYKKNSEIKLAAGWLIERCGLRGHRVGLAGLHPNHCLALVNYGTASGKDILQLATHIASKVKAAFAVCIEIEPRIY